MILNSDYRDIVKGFFDRKIVEVNTQKPFSVHGRECPVFINHGRLFSDPVLRKKVIAKWAELLRQEFKLRVGSGVIFAGAGIGGIVPAFSLAETFGCGFIYIREHPHSPSLETTKSIEGLWPPAAQVLVVSDMVRSGSEMLRAVDYLRAEGGEVLGATSISRHDFKSTLEVFAGSNVVLHSLLKMTDIFDIAYGMSLINSRQMRSIMQWMGSEDPSFS